MFEWRDSDEDGKVCVKWQGGGRAKEGCYDPIFSALCDFPSEHCLKVNICLCVIYLILSFPLDCKLYEGRGCFDHHNPLSRAEIENKEQ